MPTIIDELQILTEPEPKAAAKDPARPGPDPDKREERPPRVRDVVEAERWERRRELRVRAH